MLIVTRQFQAAFVLFPLSNQSQINKVSIVARRVWSRGGVAVFLVFLSAVDWPQILRWPQIPRPPSWFHTQTWVSPNKQAVGWKYLLRTPIVLTVLHYESHSRKMCKLPLSLETLWSTFHIKLSQVTICAPAQDVWRSSPIWIFIT